MRRCGGFDPQLCVPPTVRAHLRMMAPIAQRQLSTSACSPVVRSELLACADLLEQLATSVERFSSLARILLQKIDPDSAMTRKVPNSKTTDSELPADPSTEPPGNQCQPKRQSYQDAASASATSKRNKSDSICQHGRQRNKCKECGGGSICQHGRQRSVCKECGGGSICQHGRRRSRCKECGGASFCQHGRRRYACKECGGTKT